MLSLAAAGVVWFLLIATLSAILRADRPELVDTHSSVARLMPVSLCRKPQSERPSLKLARTVQVL